MRSRLKKLQKTPSSKRKEKQHKITTTKQQTNKKDKIRKKETKKQNQQTNSNTKTMQLQGTNATLRWISHRTDKKSQTKHKQNKQNKTKTEKKNMTDSHGRHCFRSSPKPSIFRNEAYSLLYIVRPFGRFFSLPFCAKTPPRARLKRGGKSCTPLPVKSPFRL